MPEGTSLLNNPAVTASGVAGVIAILLILILYKMLTRIDDSIHQFTESHVRVVQGMDAVGDKVSAAITHAFERLHDDNLFQARDSAVIHSKLDVILERTAQIIQGQAYQQGVRDTIRKTEEKV